MYHSLLQYFMPLNFTFMFLFYTETSSLTTLLILYYRVVVLEKRGISEFMIGIISLLMRQTNIIWANYMTIIVLIKESPKNQGNYPFTNFFML
jgi:DIE2/ALG10 family